MIHAFGIVVSLIILLLTMQHNLNLNGKRRRTDILAHLIRISEILPWDRKPYLSQAILLRLSREGFIHWLYWNSRTWSPSDAVVMFK